MTEPRYLWTFWTCHPFLCGTARLHIERAISKSLFLTAPVPHPSISLPLNCLLRDFAVFAVYSHSFKTNVVHLSQGCSTHLFFAICEHVSFYRVGFWRFFEHMIHLLSIFIYTYFLGLLQFAHSKYCCLHTTNNGGNRGLAGLALSLTLTLSFYYYKIRRRGSDSEWVQKASWRRILPSSLLVFCRSRWLFESLSLIVSLFKRFG